MCSQPLLAQGRVRFVGEPVAFVVAETVNQAKDAAETIAVDYDPLPAVVDVDDALAPGAHAIWDDNPGNEAFTHEIGDAAAVDAALAKAAHVVEHRVCVNRVAGNAMETRGCIAEYDLDEDRYTLARDRPVGPWHSRLHCRADLQHAADQAAGGVRPDGRRLRDQGRVLSRIQPLAVGVPRSSAGRSNGSRTGRKAC